jgi:hypothetical protein
MQSPANRSPSESCAPASERPFRGLGYSQRPTEPLIALLSVCGARHGSRAEKNVCQHLNQYPGKEILNSFGMGSESYKYPRPVHPLREGLKNIPVGGPFVLNWLTRPTFSLYIFSRIRLLTAVYPLVVQSFNRLSFLHSQVQVWKS